MAKVRKFIWTSKGPTGHKVRRVAYGFTAQVSGKQVRKFEAEWTSREQAEEALAKFTLGLEQQRAAATAPMTFGKAVAQYLAFKARKKSVAFDKLYLDQLKAAFGADTLLTEITAARIAAWKADKLSAVCERTGRPLTAAAINRPLSALRHLLRLAQEEWGVLATVPKIRLEKEPQGRIRWLEPDEETRLLAACQKSRNPELVPVVTVALETGLRRGELLGMTWDRVDLSRGVLRLEITKSGRRREVPMRQAVYDTLAGLPGPHEGRVFRTRSIRTAFENVVAGAKLDGFHFHDTRHHFASWFVMRGGSLQALKELLGHASLTMTLRYSHLSPEHLRNEVAKTERQATDPTFSRQLADGPASEVCSQEGVA